MRDGARLAAVVEALEALAATGQAADALLSAWLRERRYIGSKDRRRITDLFYTVLRHRLRLAWHCAAAEIEATPRALVLAALRLVEGMSAAAVDGLCDGQGYGLAPLSAAERQALRLWQTLHPPMMPESVRVECPDALAPALRRQFGDGFAAELAALTGPAPVDLRVNRGKATPAGVQARLQAEGFSVTPLPAALPDGLRLPPHAGNLRGLKAFADGWFEPQDASSQMAVAACVAALDAGTVTVLDYCAGAGGKTLALAAMLGQRGRVLAWDSDSGRLRRLAPRLARAGAAGAVQVPDTLAPLRGQCDAVLVDVPCTGTGTWRRRPEARLRYGPAEVAGFVSLQREILSAAALYVRPGGVLMYCTCSLLPEEDQDQATWFAATHPGFAALPLPVVLPADGLLSPHRTDTDGFFVALFRRQETAAPAASGA